MSDWEEGIAFYKAGKMGHVRLHGILRVLVGNVGFEMLDIGSYIY